MSKDESLPTDQSAANSEGKSSQSSFIATEQIDLFATNILPTFRRFPRHRPYSATLRSQTNPMEKNSMLKEIFHRKASNQSDEYLFQTDSNEPLTKSALIYRSMRSRLEANLAKSISTTRDRTNQKKNFPPPVNPNDATVRRPISQLNLLFSFTFLIAKESFLYLFNHFHK